MSSELGFNSKIDLWLLIVILTAVAACLWGIGAIWDANSVVFWPVALILALGGILLPIWIIVSLRYYLSDEVLRVRCGPRQWNIAIRDITSVSPTNEAKTSPALSFDRLLIEYGTGRVLISPEPRVEFLRQLEHRRKQVA
ncbi:MAG TPA: PH domain-containing protein [Gammaproteobacteria bacterium]|nr:PH domain-containing protein [Gammaproteobacteria bacterium]